jgi:hypothetical protein
MISGRNALRIARYLAGGKRPARNGEPRIMMMPARRAALARWRRWLIQRYDGPGYIERLFARQRLCLKECGLRRKRLHSDAKTGLLAD